MIYYIFDIENNDTVLVDRANGITLLRGTIEFVSGKKSKMKSLFYVVIVRVGYEHILTFCYEKISKSSKLYEFKLMFSLLPGKYLQTQTTRVNRIVNYF